MHILSALSHFVSSLLITAGIISGGSLGGQIPQTPALYDGFLVSNISKTDTSLTISPGTLKNSQSLTGYYCFTIDVNLSTVEYVCGTANGTSVTGLSRGVDVLNPNTSSTDLAFSHRRYASVSVTDFPALQSLGRMASGTDPYPQLLYYNSALTPSVISATSSGSVLTSRDYVAASMAAGATQGSPTVAGIFLGSTAREAASTTGTGVYNSLTYNKVVQTAYATDTPQYGCASGYTTAGAGCLPFALLTGKLSQSWLDIFSTANTWSALNTFNAPTTTIGASSNLTIASSAPLYGFSLNVGGKSLFTGGLSLTASTSFSNGTLISETSSTTNQTVSKKCTGCVSGQETITTTTALNGGSPSTAIVSPACSAGKKVISGGYDSSATPTPTGCVIYSKANGTSGWTVSFSCGSGSTANATAYAICVDQ